MLAIIWLQIIATSLNIGLLGWVVYKYLLIKATGQRIVMDVDELLDKLVSDEAAQQQSVGTTANGEEVSQKRETLAAVIASGQAERYLGREISIDQIDKIPATEIEKLYTRYQRCLGASMSKIIGPAVLKVYSDLAAHFIEQLPFDRTIPDPSGLAADLETNPLVEQGLSVYSGSLYHKYGMLLLPLAMVATTFKHTRPVVEADGDVGATSIADIQQSGDNDQD